MKCPLQKKVVGSSREGLLVDFFECQGQCCSWWNYDKQECVVQGYLNAWEDLANTLAEIRMKLTPELFRER